jgi:hypothetical protein
LAKCAQPQAIESAVIVVASASPRRPRSRTSRASTAPDEAKKKMEIP